MDRRIAFRVSLAADGLLCLGPFSEQVACFYFFSSDLVRAQFFFVLKWLASFFFFSSSPSPPVPLVVAFGGDVVAFHGSTISVWTLLWQQRKVPMAWCGVLTAPLLSFPVLSPFSLLFRRLQSVPEAFAFSPSVNTRQTLLQLLGLPPV